MNLNVIDVVNRNAPFKTDCNAVARQQTEIGICRMQGEEDYESYFADTMKAGHNENNASAVDCMIKSSPDIFLCVLRRLSRKYDRT